jgi:hypothetical protein
MTATMSSGEVKTILQSDDREYEAVSLLRSVPRRGTAFSTRLPV